MTNTESPDFAQLLRTLRHVRRQDPAVLDYSIARSHLPALAALVEAGLIEEFQAALPADLKTGRRAWLITDAGQRAFARAEDVAAQSLSAWVLSG